MTCLPCNRRHNSPQRGLTPPHPRGQTKTELLGMIKRECLRSGGGVTPKGVGIESYDVRGCHRGRCQASPLGLHGLLGGPKEGYTQRERERERDCMVLLFAALLSCVAVHYHDLCVCVCICTHTSTYIYIHLHTSTYI